MDIVRFSAVIGKMVLLLLELSLACDDVSEEKKIEVKGQEKART